MKNLTTIYACIVLVPFLFVACATKPTSSSAGENFHRSQIEINYVLGHSRYKYLAVDSGNKAEVSSYRDDRVLEKRIVSQERYQDFLKKLENVVSRTPATKVDESCRTPYRIRVLVNGKESSTSGCRTSDTSGQIGKILKDGEFLLYSQGSSQEDSSGAAAEDSSED